MSDPAVGVLPEWLDQIEADEHDIAAMESDDAEIV